MKVDPGDPRFLPEALMDDRKIKKACNRWDQFFRTLSGIHPAALEGPILDLGCGIGHFVAEGLGRGHDVWGVDSRLSKILRYRNMLKHLDAPMKWHHRAVVGDGFELPFPSKRFSAVSSWYVLEHVWNPGGVLSEIVRILRPGGVVALKAQDARNGWEGHYKIPWVPFLSGSLRKVWLDVFEKASDSEKNVVEITQPQVEAILETLGCRIVKRAPDPQCLYPNASLESASDVRSLAMEVKASWNSGTWRPQPENLFVYARKPDAYR
ncbi:MAG: class I SAM-dependent methyltransferase [Desulfobacterales bacterium]